jgi:hypothetical protein
MIMAPGDALTQPGVSVEEIRQCLGQLRCRD